MYTENATDKERFDTGQSSELAQVPEAAEKGVRKLQGAEHSQISYIGKIPSFTGSPCTYYQYLPATTPPIYKIVGVLKQSVCKLLLLATSYSYYSLQ